jgi:hypothetical protein
VAFLALLAAAFAASTGFFGAAGFFGVAGFLALVGFFGAAGFAGAAAGVVLVMVQSFTIHSLLSKLTNPLAD